MDIKHKHVKIDIIYAFIVWKELHYHSSPTFWLFSYTLEAHYDVTHRLEKELNKN